MSVTEKNASESIDVKKENEKKSSPVLIIIGILLLVFCVSYFGLYLTIILAVMILFIVGVVKGIKTVFKSFKKSRDK